MPANPWPGNTGVGILAEKVYECLFILDPNKYSRDPNGISGQIDALVKDIEGEMLASRMWNEQKLAYPIEGHRKGTYWLIYFRADSQTITQFNRACRLNETILRNLTLTVEPRLVEPLVNHLRGGASEPEAAAAT